MCNTAPARQSAHDRVIPAAAASGIAINATAHAVMGNEQQMSIIEKLMLRGARGELIRQHWFQSIRRDNPDRFVFGSFCAVIVVTLVLQFAMSSVSITSLGFEVVVRYPLLVALGYCYIALGTKLAHKFLLWGICLAAVAGALLGVLGTLSAMSTTHNVDRLLGVYVVPMGLIVFTLVFDLAMAAVFGYLGVMVYRGTRRLGG
jgi:hypothetical protein